MLETAVVARVDAVITDDRELLALGDYDGILIISAARFLDRRREARG